MRTREIKKVKEQALPNFAQQNLGGQVMIITIVMMGGILLSATAIAGLLLVYQIRQSNDSVSSAKAFFASDTGLEITSWCYFKGCDAYKDYNDNDCNISDSDNTAPFEATDPPASSCVFNPSSGVAYEIDSTLTDEKLNIISRGYAAGENVIRILEAEFATQ